MNISTFASRFFSDQISRIDIGLTNLNNLVNSDNIPKLIYSNDQNHFNEAIDCWLKHDKTPKLILNVLDLGRHCKEHGQILDSLRKTLPISNAVTTISDTVKTQIKELLNIDAYTIYNPIQNVFFDPNIPKTIDFLAVGRINDPNKNFRLALQAIKAYSGNFDSLHIVGSENPNIGNYEGKVDINKLNYLYNSSKFMLITSFEEGLNLPLQECLATGCIPIVCKHMTTSAEFSPLELLVDGDINSICTKIDNINKDYKNVHKYLIDRYSKKTIDKFSGRQMASNIISIFDSIK